MDYLWCRRVNSKVKFWTVQMWQIRGSNTHFSHTQCDPNSDTLTFWCHALVHTISERHPSYLSSHINALLPANQSTPSIGHMFTPPHRLAARPKTSVPTSQRLQTPSPKLPPASRWRLCSALMAPHPSSAMFGASAAWLTCVFRTTHAQTRTSMTMIIHVSAPLLLCIRTNHAVSTTCSFSVFNLQMCQDTRTCE